MTRTEEIKAKILRFETEPRAKVKQPEKKEKKKGK